MRSAAKNKKIATNAAAAQPGLNAAFAELDVGHLPSGREAVAEPTATPAPVWKLGRVVLRREMARRGGKTVIVVHDFATHLPQTVIDKAAKTIRQSCGCGGTVKGRTIEVQGDQPAKVCAVLEAEGFQVAGVTS